MHKNTIIHKITKFNKFTGSVSDKQFDSCCIVKSVFKGHSVERTPCDQVIKGHMSWWGNLLSDTGMFPEHAEDR